MRFGFMLLILICSSIATHFVWAGSPTDTTVQHLKQLPASYAVKVQTKAASISAALTKKESQCIDKLSKLEGRILSNLNKLDPSKLHSLSPSPYDTWLKRISVGSSSQNAAPTNYVSGLDNMSASLSFMKQEPRSSPSLSEASAKVAQLQGNLNQASLVDQYIQQRRQELSTLLSQYSNLPTAISNEFNHYKETAYYYRAQLQSYKDMLNNPQKIEAAALTILNHVPAYQQFFSRNSFLAGLFAAPPGGGAPGTLSLNLGGLQTRSQVQQLIQQQLAVGGSSAQQAVQQQMQAAQSQLSSLRQQVSQYGSSGSGGDMDLPPGFQPNTQKTKTFLKRLEFGANVQFSRSAYDFPATANLGLTLGYKINDKSTIGVGMAYTAGMGTNWGHIRFSSQGIGLRSFMDWRIKKSYYVVGGYEENYLTQFARIAQLYDKSAWQASALFGVEKKYRISPKLQGNMQILFDALYKQEVPQGQMIKFRFGYNF